MSGGNKLFRDTAKRMAKRQRQRAAGYRGVKKKKPPKSTHHNKGRMEGEGRAGEAQRRWWAR